MSDREILKKLVKIANTQQKAIFKLAQLSDTNEYLSKFLRTSISLYLVNNGHFAKENHTVEVTGPDSYKININLAPATKTPLSESVVEELKSFLTAKFQADPNLKSKLIDLDVQTTI